MTANVAPAPSPGMVSAATVVLPADNGRTPVCELYEAPVSAKPEPNERTSLGSKPSIVGAKSPPARSAGLDRTSAPRPPEKTIFWTDGGDAGAVAERVNVDP